MELLAQAIGEQVSEKCPRARSSYSLAVILGTYAQLRPCEMFALKSEYLDLMRRRIRVAEKVTEYGGLIRGAPKTRESRRWVSLPESVAYQISEHLRLHSVGDNRLLLTAPQGGPIRRPHFGKAWREARTSVGFDSLPFRNLRHSGATILLESGFDSLAVARRLGHTSTRMVERHYAGLSSTWTKEMADRLGSLREKPSDDRQPHGVERSI